MTFRALLSHSSHDRSWVKLIEEAATSIPDLEVYLFEHDQRLGNLLSRKVKEEIGRCDVLVVLLTHKGRSPNLVREEIGIAMGLGKKVIPLVEPGFRSEDLAMLAGVEYVQFNYQNVGVALEALLNYLDGLRRQKEASESFIASVIVLGAMICAALLAASFGSTGGSMA